MEVTRKNNLEEIPLEHYGNLYAKLNPAAAAKRLAISYEENTQCFTLSFLGTCYQISWPDFQITHIPDERGYYPLEADNHAKVLVLRYLLNAVASQGSGAYKTYREMPWGEVYLRQFDGRCIKRLAFSYGNRLDVFTRCMNRLGGKPLSHGDASFELEVFPGYLVQMILWEGDEEFPPSSQFLFSDNFPLAFAAEDIAQMGDVLIGSLKKQAALV